MTVAFGVLANGGVYQEPISVLGISDSEGHVVWDGHQHQDRRRVFSDSTAWLIVDMLKEVVSHGTGTSAKINGQVVGGKTGTNSDQKGVFFAGFTGYYASAVGIGHDNYKALSSKSTGSGAAAPLWQAYMSKIHQGLEKKDILEGDPSRYGLVRRTTCVVSGQLATDACRNDSLGYGVVTDWWAEGTEPTVSCQMHTTQTVCAETGMIASPYCPNPVQKGVVTIPPGHPLYSLLGTQYEDVLRQYLGDSAVSASTVCTLHNEFYQNPYYNGGDEPRYNNDYSEAWQMLSEAENVLAGMDPGNSAYQPIRNAADYLRMLLGGDNPNPDEIMMAMSVLSSAMGSAY